MEFRGDRPAGTSPEEARSLLDAVLDADISLIDTSPDYGRSEELIGAYISHRR